MILVTTPSVEGHCITTHHGVVTASIVIDDDIYSALSYAQSRSSALTESERVTDLDRLSGRALAELGRRAARLGANAVVNASVACSEVAQRLFESRYESRPYVLSRYAMTAIGTAVTIDPPANDQLPASSREVSRSQLVLHGIRVRARQEAEEKLSEQTLTQLDRFGIEDVADAVVEACVSGRLDKDAGRAAARYVIHLPPNLVRKAFRRSLLQEQSVEPLGSGFASALWPLLKEVGVLTHRDLIIAMADAHPAALDSIADLAASVPLVMSGEDFADAGELLGLIESATDLSSTHEEEVSMGYKGHRYREQYESRKYKVCAACGSRSNGYIEEQWREYGPPDYCRECERGYDGFKKATKQQALITLKNIVSYERE